MFEKDLKKHACRRPTLRERRGRHRVFSSGMVFKLTAQPDGS
jgi:hypothetical protein